MQRWILHVDMNSYFASVEQQLNPALRGKPVAVGGKPGTRSVIAAASREAKARGVKTAMAAHEAIQICPELIIVEPHYETYQRISERMFGILESFSPDLEIYSIDEAFLQVDIHPRNDSRKATKDSRYSVRDSVDVLQIVEQLVSTAEAIKVRLREELGEVLTASIGIAHNKRLAKLASESQKPSGLTVLLDEAEGKTIAQFQRLGVRAFSWYDFFQGTDIEALAGIGPRIARRLRGIGVHTLADLGAKTLGELESAVYPYHKELYLIARGQDASLVIPYWRAKDEQSIGHQYTLPSDIAVIELPATIAWLAERIGRRLRQGGFVAHQLSVYLRQTDGPGWSARSRTSRQLETDHDIYLTAWDLIREAADSPGSGLGWGSMIRMPNLTASGLVLQANSSQSLLEAPSKWSLLTSAIDALKDRFGDKSVSTGLSLGVKYHSIPDGRRKRFEPRHEVRDTRFETLDS